MPGPGGVVDLIEIKSRSNISETSEQEYVALANKKKLFPGDSVFYRLDNRGSWPPIYGTVIGKPPPNAVTQQPMSEGIPGTGVGPISPPNQQTVTPPASPPELDDSSSFTEVKLNDEDMVHVHWGTSNRVGPISESKLCLVDRELQRGQFVRNKDNVLGVVTGREVRATIQIVDTDHVIEDVPVSKLYPMTPFVRGQYIMYKDWIGVIASVKRHLYFKLDGGMVFYLESIENDGFEKTDIYDVSARACPGVRTKLPFSLFRRAKWLPATMRFLSKWFPPFAFFYSFAPVTTARSHVVAFSVEWLWCLHANEIPDVEQPPKDLSEEDFQDIVLIGTPSSELVHGGSIRIYKLKPDDSFIPFDSWLNNFRSEYMDQMFENFPSSGSPIIQMESNPEVDVPVNVILTKTYLEVEWENGIKETILGTKIPEVCQIDGNSGFVPGTVLAHSLLADAQKYGVVQSAHSNGDRNANKTLLVKWISHGEESPTVDLGVHEESTYDVKPHPQYALYQRGHIVMFDPPIEEQVGGTVVDVDIRAGQMIVASPMRTNRLSVFPHAVTPITKRCVWNFFSRQWVIVELLPPPHHLWAEPEFNEQENPGIVLNLRSYDTVNKIQNWAPDIPAFQVLDIVPENHKFFKPPPQVVNDQFLNHIQKEFSVLGENNIPSGIWIRGYESRLDLISILLLGEIETPYEDGLFMFDIQLQPDFPNSLPKVKFVVYSNGLSPFADADGTFCSSKLIWDFDGRPASYILNLAHQLQRLFFHAEPFFEDDRHQSLRGSSQGQELSKDYNEKVFIEVLTSFHNMAFKPHTPWQTHIAAHLDNVLPFKIREVKQWLRLSDLGENDDTDADSGIDAAEEGDTNAPPPYPLLPFSKGFQMGFTSRYAKMQQFFQGNGEESPESRDLENEDFPKEQPSTSFKETSESVDEASISLGADVAEDTDELLEIVVSD